MSSDLVISVRNVSKVYKIYAKPTHRLMHEFTFGRKKSYREFAAIDNVSFDIHKGQTVGIIGRNGSGKSTLLQLICGIRKPTTGEINVHGPISALLELGAGFHPDLTGRENIFMQGAIMGLHRGNMQALLPDIIAFSEVEDFIDQRIANYSSGMYLRLAFAVAISVQPDILIVDEALAVGDIAFQKKCLNKIMEMQKAGVTIFLVSHDLELMKHFGDEVIYLEHGRIKMRGDPVSVVEAFIRDCELNA